MSFVTIWVEMKFDNKILNHFFSILFWLVLREKVRVRLQSLLYRLFIGLKLGKSQHQTKASKFTSQNASAGETNTHSQWKCFFIGSFRFFIYLVLKPFTNQYRPKNPCGKGERMELFSKGTTKSVKWILFQSRKKKWWISINFSVIRIQHFNQIFLIWTVFILKTDDFLSELSYCISNDMNHMQIIKKGQF